MLPKTQILQQLTYPIPSEEFEWADDGIKLDGLCFKLEGANFANLPSKTYSKKSMILLPCSDIGERLRLLRTYKTL